MVANLSPKRLNMRKVLPIVFLALGLVAAALIAAAPAAPLDAMVSRLRLAELVPAAVPPIGVTGRTLLALAGGGTIALLGLLPRFVRRPRRATRLGITPPVRRADAHPDAPACRPIAAHSELGAPMPIVGDGAAPDDHEQLLPADLDLPLAAFDPDAIRPTRPTEREDWFETFPLPGASEIAAQPAASIATLLERLERGASRRAAARGRGQGLDDTLGALRKLAAN